MNAVHYLVRGRPGCRARFDCPDEAREERMIQSSTRVKADATCRLCILEFANSATPEQFARLTPAQQRRYVPNFALAGVVTPGEPQ